MIISDDAHRVIKKMNRKELADFIAQQRLDERHLTYLTVYEVIHELESELQDVDDVQPTLVLEELVQRLRKGGA